MIGCLVDTGLISLVLVHIGLLLVVLWDLRLLVLQKLPVLLTMEEILPPVETTKAPSYQQGAIANYWTTAKSLVETTPAYGYTASGRGYPDVSLTAQSFCYFY